jgi:hypothetical protein
MKRPLILGIVAVVLILAGAAAFLANSNMGRSAGLVEFRPGTGGLNAMDITGPSGWKCIEYSKMRNAAGTMDLAGRGMSDCKFSGPLVLQSNTYPSHGKVTVPLNQPTLVYQNTDKTYEEYVLITQDAAAYDRLATGTP